MGVAKCVRNSLEEWGNLQHTVGGVIEYVGGRGDSGAREY